MNWKPNILVTTLLGLFTLPLSFLYIGRPLGTNLCWRIPLDRMDANCLPPSLSAAHDPRGGRS